MSCSLPCFEGENVDNKRFNTPVNIKIAAYKRLSKAVIELAINDLEESKGDLSASRFFSSRWFLILCAFTQLDSEVIRRYAIEQPGHMSHSQRRAVMADPNAAKKSRIRNKRGRHRLQLVAVSPEGDVHKVNGYRFAASLIGCSKQGVYSAVKENRACFGWRVMRKEQYHE